MDILVLEKSLASFERDESAIQATILRGQSHYVSLKNSLHFSILPPVADDSPSKGSLIFFLLFGLCGLLRLRKSQRLIFSADAGLYAKAANSLGDRFLDLAGDGRVAHFVAVGSARGLPSPARFFRNGIIIDNIVLAPLIFVLRKLFFAELTLMEHKAIEHLSGALARHGISSRSRFLKSIVARDHARMIAYSILMRRIRPREVLLVSAAGRSFIVNSAHQFGATAIEIQHGDCGPAHKGFNYRCPKGAIATPDKLIVRNDYWRGEAIKAGFFPSADVIVGRRPEDCPICSANLPPPFLGKASGHRYIAFTSQPPVIDVIKRQVEEAYDLLVAHNLYLVYKFHPADSAESIELLKRDWTTLDRIVLLEGHICLRCLLRASTAHASFWSTCHHDAVEELGRTYVFKMNNIHHYDEYCARDPERFRSVENLGALIAQLDGGA